MSTWTIEAPGGWLNLEGELVASPVTLADDDVYHAARQSQHTFEHLRVRRPPREDRSSPIDSSAVQSAQPKGVGA